MKGFVGACETITPPHPHKGFLLPLDSRRRWSVPLPDTHNSLPSSVCELLERIFHYLYEAGDALVPSTVSVPSRWLVDAAQISE